MAYLDQNGLALFWNGLKSRFLPKTSVANNLTTTGEGYALDARQGKALNEEVGKKLAIANVANNLTTTTSGYALDARQGKALSDAIGKKLNAANVANNLTTTAGGYALDARQGKALSDRVNAKTSKSTATASLATGSWSGSGPYTQAVSVSAVTASNVVIVTPAPASIAVWGECGVYASAQAAGKLTFTAIAKPTAALTANVVCLN